VYFKFHENRSRNCVVPPVGYRPQKWGVRGTPTLPGGAAHAYTVNALMPLAKFKHSRRELDAGAPGI